MTATATQNAAIRADLLAGRAISQLTAYTAYGCTRLSARIWDLRHEGLPIKSKIAVKKSRIGRDKRIAVYYISSEDRERINREEKTDGKL